MERDVSLCSGRMGNSVVDSQARLAPVQVNMYSRMWTGLFTREVERIERDENMRCHSNRNRERKSDRESSSRECEYSNRGYFVMGGPWPDDQV